MGYYTGDYYAGDYYRGDPGIFGNIFRAVTGTIGGAIGGLLTGSPVRAIGGAIGGAVSATSRNIRSATLEAGGSASALTPALRAKHAMALTRGGAGGGAPVRGGLALGGGGGGALVPAGMMLPHMRRMHANRSTYVTRGGGTSRWPVGLLVHEKGTEAVPSRRMNVANPRALRRSIRRLQGFGKLVRRMKRAIGRASTAVGNVHRGRGRAPARRR